MTSIKQEIVKYLEEKRVWIFGGTLERELGYLMEKKNSNISRRCRELFNEGKIDRQMIQIDGKGAWVVQYRALESTQTTEIEPQRGKIEIPIHTTTSLQATLL